MLTHGTINAYGSHKCRCEECTTAWRNYSREYKRHARNHVPGFRERERSRYWKRIEFCKALLCGICVQCGTTERLEFDHIDPKTKSGNITHLANGQLDPLLRELVKCQLLCRSCHLVKTLSEKRPVTHGTVLEYRRGCRCEPCRAAMSTENREYHAGRKARLVA